MHGHQPPRDLELESRPTAIVNRCTDGHPRFVLSNLDSSPVNGDEVITWKCARECAAGNVTLWSQVTSTPSILKINLTWEMSYSIIHCVIFAGQINPYSTWQGELNDGLPGNLDTISLLSFCRVLCRICIWCQAGVVVVVVERNSPCVTRRWQKSIFRAHGTLDVVCPWKRYCILHNILNNLTIVLLRVTWFCRPSCRSFSLQSDVVNLLTL